MIARPSFRAGGLGAWFPIVALLVGVAIGILAALDPVLALTATVAIVAVPAAVLKPKLILYLVVITVFTEFLTVGGITVGRLVAPLALVAVIAELAQSPKQVRHGGMVLTFVFAYALIAGASLLWTKNASGTLDPSEIFESFCGSSRPAR